MTSRIGLLIALGALAATAARAADVRPGVPQLLDPTTSVTCIVPATFQEGGVATRVLFYGIGSAIYAKRDGHSLRLLSARNGLKGGEQRGTGVFLATNLGLLQTTDGMFVRYANLSRYLLVTPFGWVKDADGLWSLSDSGTFSRIGLPTAPWRNVVGIAPSSNYLYGANLLWVGTSATGYYNQLGLYQAVNVGSLTYAAYGLPDFYRVTDICGVTGGHFMVYNGMLLEHQEVADPYAPLYYDTGMPAANYRLQSLQYGPNDIDAVAYVGRTLYLNLKSETPRLLLMPGTVLSIANDAARRQLLVGTSAGVFAVPYTLGS